MTDEDPRVARLEAFIAALEAAISGLEVRGAVMPSILMGYEELERGTRQMGDPAVEAFEGAIVGLAEAIDGAEVDVPAACSSVSGTAVPAHKSTLLAWGEGARDEAAEFGTLAGTLAGRMDTAQAGAEKAAAALTQAGSGLASQLALVRRQAEDTARAARDMGTALENGLADALSEAATGTFAVTDHAQDTVRSVTAAGQEASQAIQGPVQAMVESHETLRDTTRGAYETHESACDAALGEVTARLVEEIERHEALLAECRGSVAGDDGAVAAGETGLAEAVAEVGSWQGQLTEEANGTENLAPLAADVRVALQVAANAEGVLDSIARNG